MRLKKHTTIRWGINMEYKHDEPWRFDEDEMGASNEVHFGLVDDRDHPTGVSIRIYKDFRRIHDDWDVQYANAVVRAKRIVACVNACAGIEDPEETIATLMRPLGREW